MSVYIRDLDLSYEILRIKNANMRALLMKDTANVNVKYIG